MCVAAIDLAELELADIQKALEARGHAGYHARQIYRWIYRRGQTDLGQMTDLGKGLRSQLSEEFTVSTPRSRPVPCAPAGARACFGGSPPASPVGGSLAGKLSADDLSQPW